MKLKSGLSLFFNDVLNFFKGGRVLGIDIGTVSIKAVELSKKANSFILENYALLEKKDYLIRANEALQTSSLKLSEDDIVYLLKVLLKEMKPRTKLAYVSLPSFSVFRVVLDLPLFSKEETQKTIFYQAKQYVPLSLNEVYLEWFKIRDYENYQGKKMQKIILIAFPKNLILSYKNIFKKANLNLLGLELENFALIRPFNFLKPTEPILIYDIGGQSTSFTLVKDNKVEYLKQIDYAGISLTQAVSRSLDISLTRAELLKRQRGLLGTGGDYELSSAIFPFLDVIINEGLRVLAEYEKLYNEKVKRVMFLGGGSELLGLKDYFLRQWPDFEVEEPLAFVKIKYRTELEVLIKNLSRNLPIALGLAIKGLI